MAEELCTICMEENISIRASIPCCDHTFCFDCIMKWSKHENTCPLCKKRFRQIDKIESSGNIERASSSRKRKGRGSNSNSVKVPRRSQSNDSDHMAGERGEIQAMMRQLFGRLQQEVSSSLIPEYMQMPVTMLMRNHRRTSIPFGLINAHRTGNQLSLNQVRFLRNSQPGDVGTTASNPVVLEESEDEDDEIRVIENPSIDVEDVRTFGEGSAGASSSSSYASSANITSNIYPIDPSDDITIVGHRPTRLSRIHRV